MDATQYPVYRGRAPLIITLGVLAVIFLGPLTGIPAWVMANQDLRDVGRGFIPPADAREVRIGRTISILGTFLSPLWMFLYCILAFVGIMVMGEMFFALL